jgi:hypothetical protein
MNDISQKRLLHDQASDLLEETGLFMSAVKAVRIRWHHELMEATSKQMEKSLIARLRALEAIPQELQGAINDYKFAADREKRHG